MGLAFFYLLGGPDQVVINLWGYRKRSHCAEGMLISFIRGGEVMAQRQLITMNMHGNINLVTVHEARYILCL